MQSIIYVVYYSLIAMLNPIVKFISKLFNILTSEIMRKGDLLAGFQTID